MTQTDFSTLSDHELDRRCAELMGWPPYTERGSEYPSILRVQDSLYLFTIPGQIVGNRWSPSTNTDQAIQVVEKIGLVNLQQRTDGMWTAYVNFGQGVDFEIRTDKTSSRAIAIATLKAAEAVKETKE